MYNHGTLFSFFHKFFCIHFDNRHDRLHELGSEATASSYSITNWGWMLEKILRPIPLISQINEEFIYQNGAFSLVEHRPGHSLRIRDRFKFNIKFFFLS